MENTRHELPTVAPDGRPDSEQPEWRQAFPIDVPREHYLTRRDFTKFLGLTSLAFAVGQLWIVVKHWLRRSRDPLPEKAIAKLSELPVGQSLQFNYPTENDGCTLIRLEDSPTGEPRLFAYDRKCPHLSCAVVPEVESSRILCPCHRGSFDLETGRPLEGPPQRPLTRIRWEKRGDTIYATQVELRTV